MLKTSQFEQVHQHDVYDMGVAQHVRINPLFDENDVIDALQAMCLRFPNDSVVSNALVDALRCIEADIDNQMKAAQQ